MQIAFALVPIGQNNLSNRQTEKIFCMSNKKSPLFV